MNSGMGGCASSGIGRLGTWPVAEGSQATALSGPENEPLLESGLEAGGLRLEEPQRLVDEHGVVEGLERVCHVCGEAIAAMRIRCEGKDFHAGCFDRWNDHEPPLTQMDADEGPVGSRLAVVMIGDLQEKLELAGRVHEDLRRQVRDLRAERDEAEVARGKAEQSLREMIAAAFDCQLEAEGRVKHLSERVIQERRARFAISDRVLEACSTPLYSANPERLEELAAFVRGVNESASALDKVDGVDQVDEVDTATIPPLPIRVLGWALWGLAGGLIVSAIGTVAALAVLGGMMLWGGR